MLTSNWIGWYDSCPPSRWKATALHIGDHRHVDARFQEGRDLRCPSLALYNCCSVAKPVGLHTRGDRPFVTVKFHLTLRSVAMQITSRSLSSREHDKLTISEVFPYQSIFTLHYRHQYHLALKPESQLTSGRPRRSLDTGVAPAKLFFHTRAPATTDKSIRA
jgi:hypothetical protein